MKAVDLRTKSEDELKAALLDARKEQFNLRFQKATGQLENTARMRTVKRDIARIKTIEAEAQKKDNKKTDAKAAPKTAAKKATKKK